MVRHVFHSDSYLYWITSIDAVLRCHNRYFKRFLWSMRLNYDDGARVIPNIKFDSDIFGSFAFDCDVAFGGFETPERDANDVSPRRQRFDLESAFFVRIHISRFARRLIANGDLRVGDRVVCRILDRSIDLSRLAGLGLG